MKKVFNTTPTGYGVISPKKRVFLLGDTHGDFTALHRYLEIGVLDNSLLIQVGDFMGYDSNQFDEDKSKSKTFRDLETLNVSLKKHNCKLEAIYGNHEAPCWWRDSEMNHEFNNIFSNITLLPDYYSKNINGKSILFVGGAVSVDRCRRKEGVNYWSEEEVKSPRFPLNKHDIMISHTCPSYFNFSPNNRESDLMKWAHEKDPELQEDLIRERDIMDHVAQTSQVTHIYSGHFHNSKRENKRGIFYRCLNIDELVELDLDFNS